MSDPTPSPTSPATSTTLAPWTVFVCEQRGQVRNRTWRAVGTAATESAAWRLMMDLSESGDYRRCDWSVRRTPGTPPASAGDAIASADAQKPTSGR